MALSAYKIFILTVFLFFFGAVLGWLIELFFRRFISKANPGRKWLNPGFLSGPWLPLYGFGVVVLYAMSLLESRVLSSSQQSGIIYYGAMFLLMAIAMTVVEFVAGAIFVDGMHIKLWDYSNEWGNIRGIVCPKFTLFWGILSALYYFFLFAPIDRMVIWFASNPWFSFVVGIFFGVFLIDLAFSLHFGAFLRSRAKEIDRKNALAFQKLQQRLRNDNLVKFFSLHTRQTLSSRITSFEEFVKRSPDKI